MVTVTGTAEEPLNYYTGLVNPTTSELTEEIMIGNTPTTNYGGGRYGNFDESTHSSLASSEIEEDNRHWTWNLEMFKPNCYISNWQKELEE